MFVISIPQSARFSRVMNLAAKLGADLTWDGATRTWTTENADVAEQMRHAGAPVEQR